MQNVKFLQYELSTGRILSVHACSGKLPPLMGGVGRIFESANPKLHYVDLSLMKVVERMEFNLSVERIGNVISITNIPTETWVQLDGEQYLVSDGEIEITVDQPVAVTLSLRHELYLKKELTIESV